MRDRTAAAPWPVGWRWRRPAWAVGPAVARAGLTTLVLYVGLAYGLGRMAESAVKQRFAGAEQVQANPVPGEPFSHRVVVVEGDQYRIVAEDGSVHRVPRQRPDAVVQAALASHSVRGFVHWMRFPYWAVEEAPDHWVVSLWDLRYQGPDLPAARGIGFVQVTVPKAGLGRR